MQSSQRYREADENLEQLTFAVVTQIPFLHPGVVRIEELKSGHAREAATIRLFEPQCVHGEIGEIVARAIYTDQLSVPLKRYRGPRFDFSRACLVHLIQKIGIDASTQGRRVRYRKAAIGTVTVPGGLPGEEVCALIAGAFESGWQRPPAIAFVTPAQTPSGTGAALYDSDGRRFDNEVQLECNYRPLVAPLVFIAAEAASGTILQFATLCQGHGSDGGLVPSYHQFAILYAGTLTYLLDRGTHLLDEPIELRGGVAIAAAGAESLAPFSIAGDAGKQVFFWVHQRAGLRVGAGLSSVPHRFIATGSRALVENTLALIGSSVRNHSVFCSECRQEYLYASHEIQALVREGFLPTLCEHTFFCGACKRWSTPAERSAVFSWEGACQHPRPVGCEEIRLSGLRPSDFFPQPASRPASAALATAAARVQRTLEEAVTSKARQVVLTAGVTQDAITEALGEQRQHCNGSGGERFPFRLIAVGAPWPGSPVEQLYTQVWERLGNDEIRLLLRRFPPQDASRPGGILGETLARALRIMGGPLAVHEQGEHERDLIARYFLGGCSPGVLEVLDLQRNLEGAEDKLRVLGALFGCLVGTGWVPSGSETEAATARPTRVCLLIDELEYLEALPRGESLSLVRALRTLTEAVGPFFTLWLNITVGEAQRYELVRALLDTQQPQKWITHDLLA